MSNKQIKEEIKTRAGKATFIWHPYKLTRLPISQVYGFCVNSDGLVVLVRDKNETRFTLPGGGVKKGESAKTALTREFIEEAQFKPKNIKLLGSLEVIESDKKGNIIKHHQQARFGCRSPRIKPFTPGLGGWETEERIFVSLRRLAAFVHWLKYPTGKAQLRCFLNYLKSEKNGKN